MKYTTVGMCPFCDSERGVTTAWGMSPQGWADLKDKHDHEHPENGTPPATSSSNLEVKNSITNK